MKRKLLITFFVFASCIACMFGLAACGGNYIEKQLGDYYYVKIDNGYEVTGVKDSHITEVVIPEGVTSIARDAFRGCRELKTITIPESVTYIGFEAFVGCDNIEIATIPGYAISSIPKTNLRIITITSGDIHDNAFKQCENLVFVKMLDGVTSIGDSAFERCKNLKKINISGSVTSIGDYGLSTVNSIFFDGTKSQWDSIKKGDMWHNYLSCIVYCTDGEIKIS